MTTVFCPLNTECWSQRHSSHSCRYGPDASVFSTCRRSGRSLFCRLLHEPEQFPKLGSCSLPAPDAFTSFPIQLTCQVSSPCPLTCSILSSFVPHKTHLASTESHRCLGTQHVQKPRLPSSPKLPFLLCHFSPRVGCCVNPFAKAGDILGAL